MTFGPLGVDLRLLVAVVLFAEVQVCPQCPQQRGSEPDSDVKSAALPALLNEKLTNLSGHFHCGGTVREAEPNGIVETWHASSFHSVVVRRCWMSSRARR